MVIKVKHEPWYVSDFGHEGSEYYSMFAELKTDDNANATDAVKMFVKAATVEGYALKSILQAMYDVATYDAFEYNIELKLDNEEEEV